MWTQLICSVIFIVIIIVIIYFSSNEVTIRNKCGGGIKIEDVNQTRRFYNISQ